MLIQLVQHDHLSDLAVFHLVIQFGVFKLMMYAFKLEAMAQVKVELLVETELHQIWQSTLQVLRSSG